MTMAISTALNIEDILKYHKAELKELRMINHLQVEQVLFLQLEVNSFLQLLTITDLQVLLPK